MNRIELNAVHNSIVEYELRRLRDPPFSRERVKDVTTSRIVTSCLCFIPFRSILSPFLPFYPILFYSIRLCWDGWYVASYLLSPTFITHLGVAYEAVEHGRRRGDGGTVRGTATATTTAGS